MKARESFFFGMIPVLFPILSDRCRNSVVFFNHCFTDTHLTGQGIFASVEAFRGGGQIAQVVGLAAVGQGAQILAAIAAGNGHTPDASLLGQGHALPLGEHTAVGEFVAGNFSVLAYQAGDGFGVLVRDGVHNVDVGG